MNKFNRALFFSEYKAHLDPNNNLSSQEIKDIDIFLNMFEKGIAMFSIPQWSYVFATVMHETGFTFAPIRESPRASDNWRKAHFRYYPYYGRGYVQLTWLRNYSLYSKKLRVDLTKKPDLVMLPEVAFYILTDGFIHGAFTGKKISDYINNNRKDYYQARRCINILDRASTIAAYAKSFEDIFNKCIINN